MRKNLALILVFTMLAVLIGPDNLWSAVSRLKTWSNAEVLTASDLNAEFNNILNNGEDLAWPATQAKDFNAQSLILDGDQDTSITADTDDQIDIEISGGDDFQFTANTFTLQSGSGMTITSGDVTHTAGNYSLANGYIDITEQSAPSSPSANVGRLYVADDGGGTTILYFKDSAGTESNLLTASGISDVVDDTTPQLGGQLDVNGNAIGDGSLELMTFTETGSAVNNLNVTNAATLNNPVLGVAGDDTHIGITLTPKGDGDIVLNSTDVTVAEDIIHAGDTDNKIILDTDTQDFQTGGSSRLDISDSGVRLGAANARVTTVLDEDGMGSDSATALATQQSIKAYVDTNSGSVIGSAVAGSGAGPAAFTSIPSGTNKIIIGIQGLSPNGTGNWEVEIGDSGGYETATYASSLTYYDGAHTNNVTGTVTDAFRIARSTEMSATDAFNGHVTLTRITGNTWLMSSKLHSGAAANEWYYEAFGYKTLSGTLDRVQVTTSGSWDAGNINIVYN